MKNEKTQGTDLMHNPYTCRLFRRIEYAVLFVTMRHPYWSRAGHLCVGNSEFSTVFPSWLYRLACKIQNKWFWTRRILSI